MKKIYYKAPLFISLGLIVIFTALILGCGGGGGTPRPTANAFNYQVSNVAITDAATLVARSCQENFTSPYFFLSSDNPLTVKQEISKSLTKSRLRTAKDSRLSAAKIIKDLPPHVMRMRMEELRKAARTGRLPRYDPSRPKQLKAATDVNFYILNGTITADRLADGTYCQVYVDKDSINDGTIDAARAANIAAAFDSNNPFNPGKGIYQRTTEVFGVEPTAGPDGQTKTIILLVKESKIDGLYGYFDPRDFSTGDKSNKCKIVYVADDIFKNNMYNGLTTVAHEFQHMINYNQKFVINNNGQDELIVINEGQSVLAEHLNGFTLQAGNWYILYVINKYLDDPSAVNVTGSDVDPYGMGYLLMLFLYEQYGGQSTIYNIATSRGIGVQNIQNVTHTNFSTIFGAWALVNLYDPLAGSPPMKYQAIKLNTSYNGLYYNRDNSTLISDTLKEINPLLVNSYPVTNAQINLKAWGVEYVRHLNAIGRLSVTGNAPSQFGVQTNLVIEIPSGTYNSVK